MCTIPKIRRAFIVFASRSFSRLLALHFHALKWQVATSPAATAPSYHFPFHNSIFADLSALYFRRPLLSSHLALFIPSNRSSFPCLRVAVSYKPGGICAQLPLSVLQSIFADLSTLQFSHSFIAFASRSFYRLLALHLQALT